MFSINAYLLS